MNEQIRELAEQAWNDTREKFGSFVDDGGEIDFTFLHTYDQKFAKLIVKECIEQLVKEGDAWEQFSRNPPEGQKTNASAALFAAHRLKEDAVSRLEEYFGVES